MRVSMVHKDSNRKLGLAMLEAANGTEALLFVTASDHKRNEFASQAEASIEFTRRQPSLPRSQLFI